MNCIGLFVLGRVVSLLNSLLFAHVFALLGLSVPTRTKLVIGMSFGVYPDLTGAWSSTGDRGRTRRCFFAENTAKRAFRSWAWNWRGGRNSNW